MAMDDVKLIIDDNALDYIVDKAIEYKLGARGLRSIFETIMMEAMYSIPSTKKKKFELTQEYAQQQLESSNFAAIASTMWQIIEKTFLFQKIIVYL